MSIFTDKVIWITGASSGIGEALTYAFAREGSKLVISARRESELLRVKINTQLADDKILILPLDLTDTNSFEAKTAAVIKHFGSIDFLVNNGGISQRSFVKDTPLEIDRMLMEVNYFGTIALTKCVLPHFLKRQSGQFIVISSLSGKFGFYLRSAYAAAKHALQGFFESLRLEVYSNNIKVLLVCPGRIKTNISLHALKADGTEHGKIDKSHIGATSVEACAAQILVAIKKKKEEIYIGSGKEKSAVWVKRLFPRLFTQLIRKQPME